MKRLALCLFPTLAFADTLPSGLDDPFQSQAACHAFAQTVAARARDPILDSIAFTEARILHNQYGEDAKLADAVLQARSNGTTKLSDEAVKVYVDRFCRSLD